MQHGHKSRPGASIKFSRRVCVCARGLLSLLLPGERFNWPAARRDEKEEGGGVEKTTEDHRGGGIINLN